MTNPSPTRPTRVVFDLGNVLIHWDPKVLYRRIFATEEEVSHFLTHVLPPEWNLEQDRGRSWAEARRPSASRSSQDHADNIRAFRARWRETVPHAIEGTVRILDSLKAQGCRSTPSPTSPPTR